MQVSNKIDGAMAWRVAILVYESVIQRIGIRTSHAHFKQPLNHQICFFSSQSGTEQIILQPHAVVLQK